MKNARRSNRRSKLSRRRRPTKTTRFPRKPKTTIVNNYAVCVDTLDKGLDAPNTPYQLTFSLTQFVRASALALVHQEYRIVKAEYRLKPTENLFSTPGSALVQSVPYLHKIINTAGMTPAGLSLVNLAQMGAKPIQFTSEKKITWKPTALDAYQTDNSPAGAAAAVSSKKSPWLRTRMVGGRALDSTTHYGLLYEIEQLGTTPEINICDTDLTLVFEFRKPFIDTESGPLVVLK